MSDDRILLAHGSGGKVSHRLISELFMKAFANPALNKEDDAAVLEGAARFAFTTDSYVVKPVFFPGGDIGKLAVCGTVNDLAMSGARPKHLSAAFVIEEGFPLDDLKTIVDSMAKAAKEADVDIVTGDTKVVERGSADQIFINTAGVGILSEGVDVSASNLKPGDKVLLSGSLGDHGVAVMSKRENLSFRTAIESDCAPLNAMAASILMSGAEVHAFRDPTRGGLASTLNEFAERSDVSITIDESAIVIADQVRGACEMLGLDPYQVANEGKMVAVVPAADAGKALAAMHGDKYGRDAAVIGEVNTGAARVYIKTAVGTTRILDMLIGEQLPRIC
ncbi:MAG: hydrogenase expression/formation protein HypE [Actinomycetota bacterium]